jgi:nitric oxide dioxygenase
LQPGRFKSEHPYTVVSNVDGVLTFGIRKVGTFFDQVSKKEIGQTLYVDGPYGVFTKEAQNTEPKVIISGGIGVTPFIDLVNSFGQNTIYINCNRKIEETYGREILKSKSTKYIDIVENYDGVLKDDILQGRITAQIIKDTVGSNLTTLPYFVCGSPMFISIVKKMLIEAGVTPSQVYFEELGF